MGTFAVGEVFEAIFEGGEVAEADEEAEHDAEDEDVEVELGAEGEDDH